MATATANLGVSFISESGERWLCVVIDNSRVWNITIENNGNEKQLHYFDTDSGDVWISTDGEIYRLQQ